MCANQHKATVCATFDKCVRTEEDFLLSFYFLLLRFTGIDATSFSHRHYFLQSKNRKWFIKETAMTLKLYLKKRYCS